MANLYKVTHAGKPFIDYVKTEKINAYLSKTIITANSLKSAKKKASNGFLDVKEVKRIYE